MSTFGVGFHAETNDECASPADAAQYFVQVVNEGDHMVTVTDVATGETSEQPLPLATNQTVHVLTIEHKHGADTTVYRSPEGARQGLVGWVRNYWAEELGSDVAIPEDDQEAIEAYFEGVPDEFYTTAEVVVNP